MRKGILAWLFLLPLLFGQYTPPPVSSATPSGPAGGALTGTYPNPGVGGFTSGASDPVTCTPGVTLDNWNTTSSAWKYCSATNTWSAGRSVIGNLKVDNTLLVKRGPDWDVKAWGAKGDSRIVTDGSITSGSATLTSATAAFTSADTGKSVTVQMGPQGVVRAIYSSGGSVTGGVDDTCTLATFNGGGSGATATVRLSATNTVGANSGLVITARGSGYATAPTTAVLGNGTATCSGTATVVSTLSPLPVTTTATYVNGTTVTLGTTATTTVSGAVVSIGTDDTAAIQAAVTAAPIGATVYLPTGTYKLTSAVTLKSGLRLRGEMPSVTAVDHVPADFTYIPNGGSWLDCSYLAGCLTGDHLRSVGLDSFGLQNFYIGIILGGANVDGISLSYARRVYMAGNAQGASSSLVGWRIWNEEHFDTDDLQVFKAETAYHILHQLDWAGSNSTWRDTSSYTYPKSVATQNNALPDWWMQGIGTPMYTPKFIRPQINSYSGDATSQHWRVEATTGYVSNLDADSIDIEGAALDGIYCVRCTYANIRTAGTTPDIVNTIHLDGNAYNNTLIGGTINTSVLLDRTGGNDLTQYYGAFRSITVPSGVPIYGTYLIGANSWTQAGQTLSTKVYIGSNTNQGILLKQNAGVFTPRLGDDSADAPASVPSLSVGYGVLSTGTFRVTRNDGTTNVINVDTQNVKTTIQGAVQMNKCTGSFQGLFMWGDSNNKLCYDSNNVAQVDAYHGVFQMRDTANSNALITQFTPTSAQMTGAVRTPASATATCSTGEIAYDASFAYFCIAANTWKRVATAAW